jgi:EAL domain protein
MKPKKFSINFIHRPEIFYEAFELELKIEGKNICEFTVDGKIEKDTANLIFLSDWFENNLEYILNENDEFPLNIQGNSGIETTERFYNNILNIEDKDIDVAYEWCEKHLWTFSGIEMMLPDVVFRRIKNKIEISWDSTDKYKDNKNYKIEFTNLKGKSFIKIEEFKKEILKFIEKIKNIYKIITDKMKSIFYGEYFNSEYLYKREETNNLQENFLKEINNLGYNFNTIYDLILLEKKHKNVILIFKKYLKLFDLDTRKNLVRFLGVKGFDEIIPLLENEFLENVDKEYRISIINSLRLIENDEIAKDYLKKLMKI